MLNWRYKLTEPYSYWHPALAGVTWSCPWGRIENGAVTIDVGYAWDGCTPSIPLPFGLWIGTPDGRRCDDGRPQAFYASLVHDFFCQHSSILPLDKAAVSNIFYDMLRERGFSTLRASIYANAVKLFGPQDWRGDVVTG